MIARITGRLEQVGQEAVLVDVGGGIWYEVLIPAFEADHLSRRLGQEVSIHTIHYLDGDPTRGGQIPRLIGFTAEAQRDFFKLFTTVKGIGVRKALRAMVRPATDIASAIQAKDAAFLTALPEIGPRTAERIIADLHGKVDAFAEGAATTGEAEMPQAAREAVTVLAQLGERRADAMALVERVLAVAPKIETTEEIIQQAYKLKASGG